MREFEEKKLEIDSIYYVVSFKWWELWRIYINQNYLEVKKK
jgi:hypothetical protein